MYWYAQAGARILNTGVFSRGDPRFGDFCGFETDIKLPTGASGYYAEITMTGGYSLMGSSCTVGQIPGPECEGEMTLPYGAVPDGAVTPGFTSNPVIFPTTATVGQLPVIVTNKFKMSCTPRRMARRLSAVASKPWFRYFSVDQTLLGGSSKGHEGSYGELTDSPIG